MVKNLPWGHIPIVLEEDWATGIKKSGKSEQ